MIPFTRWESAQQMQAGGSYNFAVLKIALSPAPVARDMVCECGWRFFIAANDVRPHVNSKADAPQVTVSIDKGTSR
jgi:hypothetical protein